MLPDCSKQCRNRRRDLRLQLAKWAHKAVLAAGLEEIAVLITHFDADSGPPLVEEEGGSPLDWSPSSDCVMCEVGQSTPTEKVEAAGPSKPQPSSTKSSGTQQQQHQLNGELMQCMANYEMMAQAYMNTMLAGQFNGLAAGLMQPELANLFNMAAMMNKHQSGNKGVLPPILPFGAHSHMFHPMQLLAPPPQRQKSTADKPNALDLSRKSGLHATVAVDRKGGGGIVKGTKRKAVDAACAVEPEEPKPPTGPGMKRNYTQADLDKAVTDIRCGRLGTRRASVVYGIPRSTLRNKIYKLEAADEQAGIAPLYKRRKAGGQSSAEKMLADVVELTARSTIKKSKSADCSPIGTPLSKSASPAEQSEPIEVIKMEEITAKEESATETEDMDEDDDLVQASLRTLAEMAGSVGTPAEVIEDATATAHIVEHPAGMDIFSQVLRNCLGPAAAALPFDFLANNLLMQAAVDPVEKINGAALMDEQSAVSPTGSDWKKQRPKRGQYRKYDKEALDEAVQSVRRGEMSVHRAGSYYGVPHSTLEYKVKERNLAKTKPRDGSQNPSEDCDSSPSPTEDPQGNNNTNEQLFAQQFTAVV